MGDIWEELQRSDKNLSLGKGHALLVLGRQLRHDIAQIPVNGQIRIIPRNTALVRGCVIIRCFIEKFCRFAVYNKTVSQPWRHPQLALVVPRQLYRLPLAKGWRAFADIHHHIQNRARRLWRFNRRRRKTASLA